MASWRALSMILVKKDKKFPILSLLNEKVYEGYTNVLNKNSSELYVNFLTILTLPALGRHLFG